VVFVDDRQVIKFFAPVFLEAFETEVASLQFLSGLQSTAPKLFDFGSVDGWHYVIMSQLAGQSLKTSWPSLSSEERREACRIVGKNVRIIHDLPTAHLDFKPFSWPNFIQSQISACVDRHTKQGLRADLVWQISPFLSSVDFPPEDSSFLHTEIMRDHIFFSLERQPLEFRGFIDFEPAMIGEKEYDFASVTVFLSSGDRLALRSFFEGYGNLEHASREGFRRRVMAYTLLHKYSNLKWYLEFMPNAESFEDLADLWCAV
jgi:hygromycin-B 7''-O-kinase